MIPPPGASAITATDATLQTASRRRCRQFLTPDMTPTFPDEFVAQDRPTMAAFSTRSGA